MTLWINEMPSWLAFVVTIAIANGLAIAAMTVARRWSRGIGVTEGPSVVNSWATCAGALTALLFTFAIVTVWNSSTRARSNMDDEASAIRLVARDLDVSQLPLLREYVAPTLAEWPQLCGGSPNPQVDSALLSLQRQAKPRLPAYSDDLYRELGTMEDLRNRRWQTSTSSIPNEIWIALAVLSCAVLVVLALAHPERQETHLALMLTVATALGTLFWVATVLEYPFCGRTGIGPKDILDIARAHLM
jgi:hypothetical protein